MREHASWLAHLTIAVAITLAGSALGSPRTTASGEEPEDEPTAAEFPALPEAITSFGAAVLGDSVFVYGGNRGSAHHYARGGQAQTLLRWRAGDPAGWTELVQGPPLQGLAMVAHDDRVIRLGGFEARNAEDEDQDLWSTDEVAAWREGDEAWVALPDLPEPRSSLDAAVLGDALYVFGGWALRGDQETVWHETAWELDLASSTPEWKPLPTPPFVRRALAAAAHDGKLYVIGGMTQKGGPTTRVDVYDPAQRVWSRGPDLPGPPMSGFGASAFAQDGRLYVSTVDGELLVLDPEAGEWDHAGGLEQGRFFHRMLPWASDRLIVIAGAHMEEGRFADIEVLKVR